jgi:exosortase family protein XrtF
MKGLSLKEFKPTIFFLLGFIGFYLIGNLLYGIYVTSFEPGPDPVTSLVSRQTAGILSACGWDVDSIDHTVRSTTQLLYKNRAVLAVYEGCNGLNTMIIFLSFILAFGPFSKPMLWFVPLSLLIIHLVNLTRVILLFFVAEYWPDVMYVTHKYLFTAILYVVIFILWIVWVKKFSIQKPVYE